MVAGSSPNRGANSVSRKLQTNGLTDDAEKFTLSACRVSCLFHKEDNLILMAYQHDILSQFSIPEVGIMEVGIMELFHWNVVQLKDLLNDGEEITQGILI